MAVADRVSWPSADPVPFSRLPGGNSKIRKEVVSTYHAKSPRAFSSDGKAIDGKASGIVDGFPDRWLALTIASFNLNPFIPRDPVDELVVDDVLK